MVSQSTLKTKSAQTNMNTRVDNLGKEVSKLQKEYSELESEISNLLSNASLKTRPRIIGALTTAGAITEKLLILIITDQKKYAQLQNLEAKQRGLFEYRRILQEIIPKQQDIHINTINQWRNLVAHANDIEKVDAHELRAVNTALKSFFEWFFTTYLQSCRPDLKNLEYNNTVDSSRPSQAELDEIKKNFEKNPLNIPDYSILSKSKKLKERKSFPLSILLILVVIGSSFFIYNNYFTGLKNENIPKKVVKPMSKEEVYQFVRSYFNSFNDKNDDPYRFFAKKIFHFYSKENINPTEAIVLRRISDYIQNEHEIDKETLYLYKKNDSASYWRFWSDFICFRPRIGKYQKCKVQMEFGIDAESKINSILEITKTKEHYYKKKPV